MDNCLLESCGKKLTHVEGRKEKSFCDANCRNKYFYAKNKAGKKVVEKPEEDESTATENQNTAPPTTGKDAVSENPATKKQEPSKFKRYDYSAMPKGLSYTGREAWKKKARAEQDKL